MGGALGLRKLRIVILNFLLVLLLIYLHVLSLSVQLLLSEELEVRHLVRAQEGFQLLFDLFLRFCQISFGNHLLVADCVQVPLIGHDAEYYVVLLENGVLVQWLQLVALLLVLDHFLQLLVKDLAL